MFVIYSGGATCVRSSYSITSLQPSGAAEALND